MKKRAATARTRSARPKARGRPARAGKEPTRATGMSTRKGPAKTRKPRAKAREAAGASRRPSANPKGSGERGERRPSAVKRQRTAPQSPSRPAGGHAAIQDAGHLTQLPEEMALHHETSPALSGGDLDADWMGSEGAGEETVGGSVATPDQDIVDEIGRALGVEQAPDEQVRSSDEILRQRAEHRWEIERDVAEEEERRER